MRHREMAVVSQEMRGGGHDFCCTPVTLHACSRPSLPTRSASACVSGLAESGAAAEVLLESLSVSIGPRLCVQCGPLLAARCSDSGLGTASPACVAGRSAAAAICGSSSKHASQQERYRKTSQETGPVFQNQIGTHASTSCCASPSKLIHARTYTCTHAHTRTCSCTRAS